MSEVQDIACTDLFYPEGLVEGCKSWEFGAMRGQNVPDTLLPEIVDGFFCLPVVFFKMEASHYAEYLVMSTYFLSMLKGIDYT